MSRPVHLAASVIVRDELDRYLVPFLTHLLEFCDDVRILDDASTDDWADQLGDLDLDRINVLRTEEPVFFEDEGAARQALLEWTLAAGPTHVLAIDADELVADGPLLRQLVERNPAQPAWTLQMEEVWKAAKECVCVRVDGGWRPHPVPILYRVNERELERDATRPAKLRQWRIPERKLAPGREPVAVRTLQRQRRCAPSGTDVLHLGWANEADRAARYQRYVDHDGGKFHNLGHLQSIMWPDAQVPLDGRDWPGSLDAIRDQLLDRINRPAQNV